MTVTICGSMKFIPEMLEWYEKLSLEGYLVYLPVFLGAHGRTASGRVIRSLVDETVIGIPHYLDVSDGLKAKLQQLHFRKIEDSDFIFVVNPGGYTGEGTMAEIKFAKKHIGNLQVPVVYLEKPEWELSPSEGVWRSK